MKKKIDNKQYKPEKFCVNLIHYYNRTKYCIDNNIFDKIKYLCCLFRLQNKSIEEEAKNICISLGYISAQDYLTYDKKIIDFNINYIKNEFLLIIILL